MLAILSFVFLLSNPPIPKLLKQQSLKQVDYNMMDLVSPDAHPSVHKIKALFPRVQLPKWLKLQHSLDPTRIEYMDLSCILAWYDIDFHANIDHLLVPYKIYAHDTKKYGAIYNVGLYSHDTGEYKADLRFLPYYLVFLYHKKHSAFLLNKLLSLNMKIGVMGEAYDDAVGKLWDEDSNAILRAVAHFPHNRKNVAETLNFCAEEAQTPTALKHYLNQLDQASHAKDKIIAQSARKLKHVLVNKQFAAE